MKLRWGTAIVLSFILFAGFIGYMVFQILKNPDLQHSMVTSNYYQKEQTLNTLIQAKKNALFWKQNLKHHVDEAYVRLGPLPTNQLMKVIGYCPSDAARDFTIETQSFKSSEIRIPREYFGAQQWEIRLRWLRNDSLFVIDYANTF